MPKEETAKSPTVAYVPFKTFLSAIEALEHGVPNRIDRTVWPSLSGLMQSQVLGAFRFLGLILSDGTPTPELKRLVDEHTNRKTHLRNVLIRAYPDLVKRDLTKMSMGSLEDFMRSYQVSGETLRKAISFFLQASRYGELPLSPYILKQTRAAAKKRRAPVLPRSRVNVVSDEGTINNGAGGSGPTKTVTLKNGITLSLKASADMFQMEGDDRQFVLKLLDEMEAYETGLKIQEAETQ